MKLCFECDRPAEYDHHVVPVVRGGTRTVPLCGDCHAKAHHRGKRMSTSELTKAGLAKAKERGVKLGSARPGHWEGIEHLRDRGCRKGAAKSSKVRHGRSLLYAQLVAPKIQLLRETHTLKQIADAFNYHGVPTPNGKPWSAPRVHRILRAGLGEPADESFYEFD